MVTRRVLAYELATTDDLEGRDAVVEAALRAQAKPADSPWFESLPAGCFRWERGRARHLTGPRVVRTPAAARGAAAEFMRQVNSVVAAHPDAFKASGRLAPFSVDTLRPNTTSPVFRPPLQRGRPVSVDTATEWLSTWTAWLPVSGSSSRRTPVVGANVELRIAPDGTVTSLSSRVRPWRTVRSLPVYEWRHGDGHDDAEGGSSGHHGHMGGTRSDDEEPPLAFVSDPPTEVLTFWSPYWVIEGDEESHHARRLWPACELTVMPEIAVDDQRGEATVRALLLRAGQTMEPVQHGEAWTLRWAVASMPELIEGRREVSEGSFVSLGAGLHHVGLEVVHNDSGARRSTTTALVVPGDDAYEIPLDDDFPVLS